MTEVTEGDVSAAVAGAFGRLPAGTVERERDAADFRRVGLTAQAADRATGALARGTYSSFEEAAVMASAFRPMTDESPSHVNHRMLASVLAEREHRKAVAEALINGESGSTTIVRG